ncbi:uncharacterized protein C7orf57 homolog [Astyanax mexicanus]|uniref:Si:dkey-276j7.1 n=2 Tax=Astyanax mexicanus TaxID=7994 RepID=A0A3B1IKX8_ASTMX|nr:uncharacterized protein C7orf57 homolog [Astyanax mexicanus]XP_022530979.1 uncharacterized protein C7orf57 homolog [Astyanax mexicanus]KAG9277617.1 hypothetical protein AMEX_G7639 [Astyanax mexicanus]
MSAEPNYRRTKPGMRTCIPAANGASGPSSQIPGLSQTANDVPEEKSKGRRVGIQATDSDYVKLAKQGGHRGLLSHDDVEDAQSKSSSSMKRPEWLAGTDGQQSQGKASTQRLVAPFGTDESSAWDIESDGAGANKTKVSVSPVAQDFEKLALSPEEIEEACKYKRLSHDKKAAAPVSMSKLLSFGYMEDEKKSPEDDASSMTSEQTSTIAPEDELE